MHVTIFGRPGCLYCVKAKTLSRCLESTGVISGYNYVDIRAENISKEGLSELVGKPVETVPQIFFDKTPIGGYTELKQFIENQFKFPEGVQQEIDRMVDSSNVRHSPDDSEFDKLSRLDRIEAFDHTMRSVSEKQENPKEESLSL